MKRAETSRNSGDGSTQIIGCLDVRNNIGRLPDRRWLTCMQTDSQIAAPGRPRHADDVELNLATHRVALQSVFNPYPDFVECCGRLAQKFLEAHRVLT